VAMAAAAGAGTVLDALIVRKQAKGPWPAPLWLDGSLPGARSGSPWLEDVVTRGFSLKRWISCGPPRR